MTNESSLSFFKKLLDTTDQLLGPGGCPWDREQTVVSMRASILEEACEVIEAVDEGSDADLIEELGDLLYNVLFFSKLAEKEGRFPTEAPIAHIEAKLVSRHPHVFGNKKIENMDEVIDQWEAIKKEEKSHRESLLDGIPKGLPALARAYKMAGKMEKKEEKKKPSSFDSEEQLGELLWEIVLQARTMKLNPELALRKELLKRETIFREKERDASHS